MTDLLRITKKDKLFTRLRWACLATASNGGSRPALELLYVEKKDKGLQFTGCDGNRVHRFITDIDPRFKSSDPQLYDITKTTKFELIITKSDYKEPYPDINKVIPENMDSAKSVTFTYATDGASIHAIYAVALRLAEPEWAIDAALFAKLLSADIAGEKATIKVFATVYCAYIILEAKNIFGLLMPIKIKNTDLIIEEYKESTDGSDLLD